MTDVIAEPVAQIEVIVEGPAAPVEVPLTTLALTGPRGPQGIAGPAGPAGAAGGNPLVFIQVAPAATWTITHPLGRRPAVVTVLDADDVEVEADIDYDAAGLVVITFAVPFSGTAILI